ncbi:HlyC/CorC family transporter [Pseudomonas matsuisoli]|nr:transporter associated domain-containing protein [Pseudomonas matsuisoli]
MSEDRSSNGHRSWMERIIQAFAHEPKNRQELLEHLREAHENKLLDSEALAIVEGAIQVADLQVRDIMVPRSQMMIIKAHQTPQEFLPAAIEAAHSRYPVIGESLDEVKGILLAKDLLPLLLEGAKPFDIDEMMRPATFVPESKRLNVLLREFRANRSHMAIVIDEYGGVAGLVTIEDVLEQIVGDIEDEHDVDGDNSFIKALPSGDFIVKALTPVDAFNEFFDTEFSEEAFDTVGGLVMAEFGHLPKRNEVIEVGDFRFRVLNADSRRLHLLRLTPLSR